MNIKKLKEEIITDPLIPKRGYAAMTDAEIAVDMNTVYRQSNKTSMAGTEILNVIDKSEFNALTTAKRQSFWNILHLGNINPFGIEADLLVDIFGGGSITISNLQGLRKKNISRADELGIGKVREGHVLEARV